MTDRDTKPDDIYAIKRPQLDPFRFDDDVVSVFPDMINRSVPGYAEIVRVIGLWAERYMQPGTVCYDLGCSLGAVTFAIGQRPLPADCRIVAVDQSAAMLSRLRQLLDQHPMSTTVDVVQGDIQNIEIVDASLVVLNFTLQFIPEEDRLPLMKRIYQGLRPGGIVILSEKIIDDDHGWRERLIDIHHDFKRANGYSELEVSQKRDALENVLIPETAGAHIGRFAFAGFSHSRMWYQAINFASFVAIK